MGGIIEEAQGGRYVHLGWVLKEFRYRIRYGGGGHCSSSSSALLWWALRLVLLSHSYCGLAEAKLVCYNDDNSGLYFNIYLRIHTIRIM
jgi:hypothetical protein